MTDSFQHFGPTASDALETATRLVVHVDDDSMIRAETAAAVTAQDPATDVVSVADVELARAVVEDLPVDGVVLGDVGWTDFLTDVDAPVALYTTIDPADLDDRLLSAADTFIERRSDRPSEFLARKVLSLVEADAGRTEYALARALSRVSGGDDRETHEFVVDDEGSVLWSSAPFERVFPVGELRTTPPQTDGFDERLQRLLADSPDALATVFRTENRRQRESFTVRTAAGESHYVHTGYRLPPELDSLRLEVFEHVTTEVQRAARVELLELLVEESRDGLYTLDAQGNIEFCNRRFAEMLGYDPGELIGQHATAVLVDGELEHGQARIVELLEDEDRDSATVDLTFRTRAGERLEMAIHFALLPAEDDSYAGLMGVARDISTRKERERALRKYRQLVEAARDPMFVLDAEGHVTLYNEAMARIVDADELEGRALTALFEAGERGQIATLLDGLRTGESEWEQYELRLTEESGSERLYEATVGALRDDARFAGTVGTLRDITERDRRTHELDLLKQVLDRVLRHNIRSQLTVVQSYAEQLRDGTVERQVAGESILDSVDSLLATSEKAREIERLVDNETDRRTLDLATVASTAVDSVAADHPDSVYEVEVPSVRVRAHPALETAVRNAVENAVVHTDDSAVRLTARVTDDSVELRISDDGPGIPDTDLSAIEERAETPLQHTSGAGLWLIDWVVDRSGGALAFDSDGDGTTVRIELDRSDADTLS
mgnify:CR=1 FL=1